MSKSPRKRKQASQGGEQGTILCFLHIIPSVFFLGIWAGKDQRDQTHCTRNAENFSKASYIISQLSCFKRVSDICTHP